MAIETEMPFDKFEARCALGWKSAYAQLSWKSRQHHERLKRFIQAMPKKLVCQGCGGAGGEIEVVTDEGQGPWYACGWCDGIGYMTPYDRGMWLRFKREEKRERHDS